LQRNRRRKLRPRERPDDDVTIRAGGSAVTVAEGRLRLDG
jgi:hypothetical protein